MLLKLCILMSLKGISVGVIIRVFFAPDKYYGPQNTLKAFIDKCHQNKIAVIMDIVLNHSFGSSPIVQLYWNSYNKHAWV